MLLFTQSAELHEEELLVVSSMSFSAAQVLLQFHHSAERPIIPDDPPAVGIPAGPNQ